MYNGVLTTILVVLLTRSVQDKTLVIYLVIYPVTSLTSTGLYSLTDCAWDKEEAYHSGVLTKQHNSNSTKHFSSQHLNIISAGTIPVKKPRIRKIFPQINVYSAM